MNMNIPRSKVEPNMEFFSSFEMHGYRFRMFQNGLHYRPLGETFHEFLEFLAIKLFDPVWWKCQAGMKRELQHVIFQWSNDYNMIKSEYSCVENQEPDGTFSVPVPAYIILAIVWL